MNISVKLTSLLVLTSILLVSSVEGHEIIKYVQGGACEGGDGSKKHPFNNLEDAEAADWDVLKVLSSTVPLDGGITLKDGQKLIGEEDPTGITLSPTQPIITNSDVMIKGGNAVIVTGDATIENIYFRDTKASAIQYNDAKDLTVKNVLIAGYDQSDSGAGGISGTCPQSGETRIIKVIVRESNGFGPAIVDEPINGAHRALLICTSEFTGLLGGIESFPHGTGTTSSVQIKNSYVHDAPQDENFYGIVCNSYDNAKQSILVKDSRFTNLGGGSDHIFVSASDNGISKLSIDKCSFEESFGNNNIFAVELSSGENASLLEVRIENCTINLLDNGCNAFYSKISGGTQDFRFIDNKVTLGANGQFYAAASDTASSTTNVAIKDNFFTGANVIAIFPSTPWVKLSIEALHNCFQGDGTSPAFLGNNNPAGNAIVHAHKNSISGFLPDIEDAITNTFYDVTKNWWGHPLNPPCNPGVCPQPQFQTCIGGTCQGPVVVGATNVDASDPLSSSIKCAHNCCEPLPTPPAPQP